MEGQLSIFDFLQCKRSLNDYWKSEKEGKPIRLTTDELQAEQNRLGERCAMWFIVTEKKCCGCYPMLKMTRSWLKELSYAECLVCGKHTEPVDDYSWKHTVTNWNEGRIKTERSKNT